MLEAALLITPMVGNGGGGCMQASISCKWNLTSFRDGTRVAPLFPPLLQRGLNAMHKCPSPDRI